MARIAITGSLGYVAPSLIQLLRKEDPEADLVGIDVGWFAAGVVGGGPAPETALDVQLYTDIRDLQVSALQGVDHVVHLAALSNDPLGDRFAKVTEEINYAQSVRLCHLARDAGARSFTFASSGSVYGAGGDTPRDEASPLAPLTAYARSKIATEQAVTPLATDQFAVTCLRFATACGWSPRIRLDLVLNDFVASALTRGRIDVLSDGTPWRPLIHVADMARALAWAISSQRLSEAPPGVVTNVGCDEWNFQISDLAQAVADVITGVDVSINADAPADRRSYRVDFQRWRGLAPDHQPLVTLSGAVEELAMQLGPILTPGEDFRRGRLIRLEVLQDLKDRGLLSEDLRFTHRRASVGATN
jgi:nucleoside-diphosphate-sugar epimerase